MGELTMSMPIYTFSDSSSGSPMAANGEHLTADKVQDNPVGITEKYIYIIRNYINDKVYIGQAIDPEERFKGHIADARRKCETSAIDGAIYKYGAENFYYEVLEDKTPDYNNRERYWIAFFNSKCPNGYNIMDGGDNPPIRRGLDNNKCPFSSGDVEEIRNLLLNPHITLHEIAQAYGVTYKTISHINKGITHHIENVDYPIRKFQCSGEYENQLSTREIENIAWELLYTDKSFRRIAMEYKVNHSQVSAVNDGQSAWYHLSGYDYPLRPSTRATQEQITRIKEMLMEGIRSKNQIASEVGVTYALVTGINSGRIYFDENLVYPLKRHEGRYDYGESVWEEIRSRLKSGEDPKQIAAKMHLPNISMVYDINVGKSHVSDAYSYPIRTFENKYSPDMIRELTHKIATTDISLSKLAKEYGMHKSTVVQIKNGQYKKYRLPDYNYPLR